MECLTAAWFFSKRVQVAQYAEQPDEGREEPTDWREQPAQQLKQPAKRRKNDLFGGGQKFSPGGFKKVKYFEL